MAIEGIKNVAMSYQAATAKVPETNNVSATKTDSVDVAAASTSLAQEIMAMNTKEVGADMNGESNAEPSNQEAQNAQIKKAVDEINKKANNSEAIFGVHDKTNRVTIKIVDKKTKEIIKEFPPDKTLDMIAKVWEMAGLMVDEKR